MASETITRNDLTAILNEVLPPTPSEYKKLLWTNPNTQSAFSSQYVYLDLSSYDAVGIDVNMYTASSGEYHQTFYGRIGENLLMSGMIYQSSMPLSRLCEIRNTSILFNDGYANTSNNQAVIPIRIYGIKYERVAPPQISGWTYITSVTGSNTVTFEDLAAQGYSEVFVKDSGGYSGGYAPVIALPTALTWGGFYSGVNGLLHGVDITTTSIKGRYGMTDSNNYLASMTFYLYAR